MHRHAELVHTTDFSDLIASIAEDLQVSGEGGGVAAKNAQSARGRTFRILTLWAKEVNDIQR